MNEFTTLYFQAILSFLITKEAHELGIIDDENYKKYIQDLYTKIIETNQSISEDKKNV